MWTRTPPRDRRQDGRYGPYVTEVLPAAGGSDSGVTAKKGKKPTGPKTHWLQRVAQHGYTNGDASRDALKLLSLPRVVAWTLPAT